jgi:hypothetical protein
MNQELYEILETHFSELGLLKRFALRSPEVFSETVRVLKVHFGGRTPQKVKTYLVREADSLSKTVHLNYWRAVLYRELAESDEFIAICI